MTSGLGRLAPVPFPARLEPHKHDLRFGFRIIPRAHAFALDSSESGQGTAERMPTPEGTGLRLLQTHTPHMQTFHSLALTSCLALAFAVSPFRPAQDAATQAPTITENDVITGKMDIEFKTRTQMDTTGDLADNSPALGAKDIYRFNFSVAKTTVFSGEITRQPNLYSDLIRSRKQEAALTFDVDLAVVNPKDMKQKVNVGKWVGLVPIDTGTGAFNLAGGSAKERPLRIAIDTRGQASGFTDNFAGKMVGKAEKKDSLAAYSYKRLVGKKTVTINVKAADPMRFDNLVLAKGPAETYPRTTVNGRLDYDYETGNWFTDGIRFKYSMNGQDMEDIVTGSIKWVEDPDRASNGIGYYEFNLRFNEEKNKTVADESAAFQGLSDEEAFFYVDDTVPAMTGRINYVDTLAPGSEAPSTSKVTYNLNANKLNKQQIMNFFKLWMICVGPTNDE